MASDRVQKYFDDCNILLAAKRSSKITAEVHKLTAYIQKHQNDVLSENAKTKLIQTIEAYWLYARSVASAGDELFEAVQALLADMLSLPEGKLVTSKGKKKLLSWLESSRAVKSPGIPLDSASALVLSVIDVDSEHRSLTLLDEGSGDVSEGVEVEDSELFLKIQSSFAADEDSTIRVTVSIATGKVSSLA